MTQKASCHLYSKYFTQIERRALKAIPEHDLSGEIKLLRVEVGRFFKSHGRAAFTDLNAQLHALRATSDAVNMIASLVRTQFKIHSPDTELKRAIDEAMDSLRIELNIE